MDVRAYTISTIVDEFEEALLVFGDLVHNGKTEWIH